MEAYENNEQTSPKTETLFSLEGDRPIYLTLAAGALASVAAVPVILAVLGAVPVIKLLWAAFLAGFTLACGTLMLIAIGSVVRQALVSAKAHTPKASTPSAPAGGKLAFE